MSKVFMSAVLLAGTVISMPYWGPIIAAASDPNQYKLVCDYFY